MIIAFAGQIASGKSTLAAALSKQSGWPIFSFGSYVAGCALKIGLDPNSRETLQDLGACLSKHPEALARGFLEWAGPHPDMIIDGIRHVSVLQALSSSATNQQLRLAFVDTPPEIAASRFAGDLEKARGHIVEADIENLKPFAEWILPDSAPERISMILPSA